MLKIIFIPQLKHEFSEHVLFVVFLFFRNQFQAHYVQNSCASSVPGNSGSHTSIREVHGTFCGPISWPHQLRLPTPVLLLAACRNARPQWWPGLVYVAPGDHAFWYRERNSGTICNH